MAGGARSQPLHARLGRALRERIDAGDLPPDHALPGERHLMARYGVSRATVRQAIADLCAEGVLYRVPRRGTFVAPPQFSSTLGELVGFAEELRARGVQAETQLLTFGEGPADAAEAEALAVRPGERVVKIERLVRVDGLPLFADSSALPPDVGGRLRGRELRDAPIYTLLERHGLRLRDAEQTIAATRAGPREAQRLNVAEGSPILRVRRVTRDAAGRAVEVASAYYRGDRYQYRITLRRPG